MEDEDFEDIALVSQTYQLDYTSSIKKYDVNYASSMLG